MRIVYAWRAWYIFSRDQWHDVIEIGPEFLEQKGNVLRIVQPTMRSMLGVYNIRPWQSDTCSKLSAIFALFPALSRWVHQRANKFVQPPFYLRSTFDGAHVR